MGDERVNEHVGGAGVEGKNLRRLRGGRNHGDISDATHVERDAAEFWMAVEQIVSIGNERRALAAEGDVRRTKIADSRDACARGDDGRLTDLQSGGCW